MQLLGKMFLIKIFTNRHFSSNSRLPEQIWNLVTKLFGSNCSSLFSCKHFTSIRGSRLDIIIGNSVFQCAGYFVDFFMAEASKRVHLILHFCKQSFSIGQVCSSSSIPSCPKVKQKSSSGQLTCWQTNTFTSHVPLFSWPGCSTNTSQSCVPLLPNLTDLNPFFPCQDALYHLYTRFLTCRYLCVQQVCAQTQSEKPLYRSWSSTCLLNRPTQVFCVLHIHPQSKEVKKVDSCWHETNVFFCLASTPGQVCTR